MQKPDRVAIFELQKKVHHTRMDLLNNKNATIENIFDFIQLVEELNTQVRKLRATTSPDDPLLVSSEDTLSFSAHDVLLYASSKKSESYAKTLSRGYRDAWRNNFSLFLFTAALFVISTILGYAMTLAKPDYGSLFIGQAMIESIMDHQAWFERIQNNPLWHGFEIALNNIRVSILAFALGAVAGIGGIYIMVYNGLMVGAVMALCQVYGFEKSLLTFIVGHGFLELTLIVVSVFGGLIIGRSFYHRPTSEIGAKMKQNTRDALYILYGVSTWLCVAAIIEVGISPFNYFTPKTKIFIGLVAAAAFWYWTFKPEDSGTKR